MGLLWPGLMRQYGAVLGLPFGFEGIFFFLEAIFTGIYLYGWRRLRGWAHFWSGMPIAVSGIFGAIAVMAANSWMNQPGGFTLRDGRVVGVDTWEVFWNRAAAYETPHMVLAAYMVAGFGVASVYAFGMLKGRRDRYHVLGFGIPFTLAAVLTPIQIVVGDTAARAVASQQPVKFATMEYVARTGRGVPEYIGGIYLNGHVYFGIRIPDLDSLLVGLSPNAKVVGWDSVAPVNRPPAITLVHLSFDAMVGIAFLLLAAGAWALVAWRRSHALPQARWFWCLGVACGPAAVMAMECGWIVTEVGRQPWVVYNLMTTSQAATTNQGVIASLTAVIVLYAVLGVATVVMLRVLARRWRQGPGFPGAPYGPPADRELEPAGEAPS
jgi:cytochrome bd ubiquinol oxidase subunit I